MMNWRSFWSTSQRAWSYNPLDQKPAEPSHEIYLLADQAELIRLCEMKVTEEVHADDLKDEEQLTTKLVRDSSVRMERQSRNRSGDPVW